MPSLTKMVTGAMLIVAQQQPVPAVWPAYTSLGGGRYQSLGNHRFNVTLPAAPATRSTLASATAQWRRSDSSPLEKAVYITTASNHTPLNCSFVGTPTADSATFAFTTVVGETGYFIYYMPLTTCEYAGGGCVNGAQSSYIAAGANGSCAAAGTSTAVPSAAPVSAVYDTRAEFESFEPMEMPMTKAEHSSFIAARGGQRIIAVAEAREYPVKMKQQLPMRWVGSPIEPQLEAAVHPGEHFTFQVALANHVDAEVANTSCAYCAPIKMCNQTPWNQSGCTPANVTGATFGDLVGPASARIPAKALRCMNTVGVDFWGRDYTAIAEVPRGEVKALWFAAIIPADAIFGRYHGVANIHLEGGLKIQVQLALTVGGAVLPHGGDDDIERGTRLHWFDSRLGLDSQLGDVVPTPFVPIAVSTTAATTNGMDVAMLGKTFHIGATGLPVSINVDAWSGHPELSKVRQALALGSDDALQFAVNQPGLAMGAPQFTVGKVCNMSATWTSVSTDAHGAASVVVAGSLDATGYSQINVTVHAHRALTDGGVELKLATNPDTAIFAMGLGKAGGLIERWAKPPAKSPFVSWLVLDFGKTVHLDGLRLYSHGDNVHDVVRHFLQAATPDSTPDAIAWGAVVGQHGDFRGSPSKGVDTPQDYSFEPTSARIWRWVITDVVISGQCGPRCQPDVAEIEFRHVGNSEFTRNHGTHNQSLILNCTDFKKNYGGGTAANPAWKAVDGRLLYADWHDGWDALQTNASLLPDPPPQPEGTQNRTSWQWDGQNGNNGVWFGNTKVGVRLELKGDDPLWWAGAPYDNGNSPEPPESWHNAGGGGIDAFCNGSASFYSGMRPMDAGESVSYVFSLMVTPVRPFDMIERFRDRWAQGGAANYTELHSKGVTVMNIHQGNSINPWINYPYLTNRANKWAAEQCHLLGMKYSVYNTMRELSNRCREYWAMISFGDTLVPAACEHCGGADWLQEHIRTGYLPAWSNPVGKPPCEQNGTSAICKYTHGQIPDPDAEEGPFIQDAGMRVVALSRWNNYYIAGLNQIKRDYAADGVYLDEIAYDRTTMLRARRVLGDGGTIDHHCHIGFVSHSCAMNYMELYPFITRLWYGEGFNYDTPDADNWLIETAAFETGLSADMLRYAGPASYAYRGMLVGSAFRYNAGNFDPTALWALWDAFDIMNSTMIGWWEDYERPQEATLAGCSTAVVPVATTAPNVLKLTVYVKWGTSAMIVIADWNHSQPVVNFELSYNWTALGLSSATAKLTVPLLPPFQVESVVGEFAPSHQFRVNATQGGLLLILQ